MTIVRRQTNGSASTGTLDATPPAWSSTPLVGSLLLIIGHETQGTAGTWGTTPAGYTAFTNTPFIFSSTATSCYGLYWKIAGAGEATPGHYGEVTSTQDWVTYTYEFTAPFGWVASPPNQAVVEAQDNTAVTSTASGNTGQLEPNMQQLAIAMTGHAAATTSETYTGGFLIDRPGTNNGKLWFGWQEVGPDHDQLAVTANWTTSTPSGARIATFRAKAYDLQPPGGLHRVYSQGC